MTYADLSPLANHLWQSTVFAGAMWTLTVPMRQNRAAVRYWLWVAASVKFLIPFSLVLSACTQLGRQAAAVSEPPQWSLVAGQISQPFTTPAAAGEVVAPAALNLVPAVLFAIWMCGVGVGIVFWLRCWRQMRITRRAAAPLALGLPIPVLSSPTRVEPGVFGIREPVLLLPEGILHRLTPAQLAAVIAHEMCHVRRRDNLTAAIHMLVEVLLWFYPLVWWIRGRLVEERENACDEEVLRSGSDASVYAEGILNVCRLYVECPLVCASGVTGSDLKKRIENILHNRKVRNLNLGRKLLLAFAGMLTVTVPVVIGLVNVPMLRSQTPSADRPAFEVASVKRYNDVGVGPRNARSLYSPQGVDFRARTLGFLIAEAYGIPAARIVPAESKTKDAVLGNLRQGYDIAAKADHSVSKSELRLMLQSLLADRFKLTMHRETVTRSVYKLVVAPGGAKLEASEDGGELVASGSPDGFTFRNSEVFRLTGLLSSYLDRMVVDETGLNGLYNFVVKIPEDLRQVGKPAGRSPDSPAAGTFASVLKPLGLQLIAGMAPVEYLVVDHIEPPSEN
jgi:uncharacterized protein (TIGR03435 family)